MNRDTSSKLSRCRFQYVSIYHSSSLLDSDIHMRKVWLIFAQSATVAMAVLFVVATFAAMVCRGYVASCTAGATVSVAAPGIVSARPIC